MRTRTIPPGTSILRSGTLRRPSSSEVDPDGLGGTASNSAAAETALVAVETHPGGDDQIQYNRRTRHPSIRWWSPSCPEMA